MQKHTHTQNSHTHAAPSGGTGFVGTSNGASWSSGQGPSASFAMRVHASTAATTATSQDAGTGDAGNLAPYATTNILVKY